jgi:hypothetical protein
MNILHIFTAIGTSFYPCSEIFHGESAFSEPESRNIRDAIIGPEFKGRIKGG